MLKQFSSGHNLNLALFVNFFMFNSKACNQPRKYRIEFPNFLCVCLQVMWYKSAPRPTYYFKLFNLAASLKYQQRYQLCTNTVQVRENVHLNLANLNSGQLLAGSLLHCAMNSESSSKIMRQSERSLTWNMSGKSDKRNGDVNK